VIDKRVGQFKYAIASTVMFVVMCVALIVGCAQSATASPRNFADVQVYQDNVVHCVIAKMNTMKMSAEHVAISCVRVN